MKIANIKLWNIKYQARNQEFLRAGEVSENRDTSINISFASYERKALQGKISVVY